VTFRERARISPDDLGWLGSVVAALLLAAAFAWLTPALAKLYPSPDQALFPEWTSFAIPEPLEDVRSMLTLAMPFVLAAVMLMMGSAASTRRSLDPLVIAIQIGGVGLLTWSVLEQRHVLPVIPSNYFQPLLLSVPNFVAGVLIGGAMTALILFWSGGVPGPLRAVGRLGGRWWLPLAAAVIATAVFVLPAVVTDSTIAHAGPFVSTNIPTHAEDYFAVVNGRTPTVDYIAQYANLLPLALAPVLAAFDSSITSFSIAVCILSAAGLLAIFGVFTEVTRRPWAALALYVPFLALSLFPWHAYGAVREFAGNYYALLPDRLLGPFLLAWLCALHVRRRRIPMWAMFLLAGLTVLNNPEFGTGALIALALALLAGSERSLPLRQRLTELVVQGVIGVLAALAIVSVITLARTGDLPNPTLLTYYNHLFLREGVGLLPMQSLGLHWAYYATYAAALLVASARYVQASPDRTLTAMLAFSGSFGLITGMYFVGRSVEFQLLILLPVWALCLTLVAWTAAGALRSARRDRERLSRLVIPATAALIGFGLMVSAIDRVSPPWRQLDRLAESGRAVDDTPNAERFIETHTDPGDRVLVIGTPLDHRVADRAGVTNVSPLNGYVSLLSPAEADRALDQLQSEGGKEVFEEVTEPPAFTPTARQVRELAPILRQRGYRLIERDPSSGLRLWRD
jgi:hypothetical protein